jgi:hypothetical protein
MGRMKEIFMRQIEEQLFRSEIAEDEDYDYEQFIKQEKEVQKEIDKMNDSIMPKYSDSDIEEVLGSVFSNFQISQRLKTEIIEMILTELNNLNNLRNGNTD